MLAACSFNGASGGRGAADAAVHDSGPDADFGPDASPPSPIASCPEAPELLGCWLLDGNANDDSGNDNNASSQSGVDWVPGMAGEAALFTLDDRVTVSENNNSLDLDDAYTIEAWIHPAVLPTQENDMRAGIFDNNAYYSMFLYGDGNIRCTANGPLSGGPVEVGEWSHVACVFSESDGAALYINGVEAASRPGPLASLGDGNGAIEIGSDAPYQEGDSHYQGMIDNLLVWGVRRSLTELCETSGLDC